MKLTMDDIERLQTEVDKGEGKAWERVIVPIDDFIRILDAARREIERDTEIDQVTRAVRNALDDRDAASRRTVLEAIYNALP